MGVRGFPGVAHAACVDRFGLLSEDRVPPWTPFLLKETMDTMTKISSYGKENIYPETTSYGEDYNRSEGSVGRKRSCQGKTELSHRSSKDS